MPKKTIITLYILQLGKKEGTQERSPWLEFFTNYEASQSPLVKNALAVKARISRAV
jgi:hypothetical protein